MKLRDHRRRCSAGKKARPGNHASGRVADQGHGRHRIRHHNMTVCMPPEVQPAVVNASAEDREKIVTGAAAAALAAELKGPKQSET